MLREEEVIRLLASLLLTGCALQRGSWQDHPQWRGYYARSETVNVVGCDAFPEAQEYLRSHGIDVQHDRYADRSIVCVPGTPLFGASGRAEVGGRTAWVSTSVFRTQSVKLLLHELMHLLFATPHSATGVMFPMAEGLWLATGLSDDDLRRAM